MTTLALRWMDGEVADGDLADRTGVVAPSEPVTLGHLAAPGRLIEISGGAASARLTTAVSLVRQAQLEGETTVWIQPVLGPLFPPDLAESGVDLDALIVIHVPEDRGPAGIARAAELLLRSGGYGLCVLDLSAPRPPAAPASEDMPARTCPPGLRGSAWQARLAGLARAHGSRVVLLTRSGERRDSLGPMVSVRLAPRRERRGPGVFAVRPAVLKHKGGPPVAPPPELRRGPWGLA